MSDVAPFERVVYNGALMDEKTKAFVQAMEAKLGYPLTIVQGCYNRGGVSASAGTHDLGGVVDLVPWDFENKVKVARELGAFAWHRLPMSGRCGSRGFVYRHGWQRLHRPRRRADAGGDPAAGCTAMPMSGFCRQMQL